MLLIYTVIAYTSTLKIIEGEKGGKKDAQKKKFLSLLAQNTREKNKEINK